MNVIKTLFFGCLGFLFFRQRLDPYETSIRSKFLQGTQDLDTFIVPECFNSFVEYFYSFKPHKAVRYDYGEIANVSTSLLGYIYYPIKTMSSVEFEWFFQYQPSPTKYFYIFVFDITRP